MLPRTPLRLGLTEVKGVSVPAREVGGDFFNYFQVADGQIALLVGDVSGIARRTGRAGNARRTGRAGDPLDADADRLADGDEAPARDGSAVGTHSHRVGDHDARLEDRAGGEAAVPQRLHGSVTYGSLAMDVYAFGKSATALGIEGAAVASAAC